MRKPNLERAKKAAKIIRNYSGTEEEIETEIVDVLADLRHLCDREGFDFAELDGRAYDHYANERAGIDDK